MRPEYIGRDGPQEIGIHGQRGPTVRPEYTGREGPQETGIHRESVPSERQEARDNNVNGDFALGGTLG